MAAPLLRLILRELRYVALFFILVFAPAQTLEWSRGWILVVVVFVIRIVGALIVLRANPDLLAERAKMPLHRDQPTIDKFLLPAYMAMFAGVIAFSSADHFHLRLFPVPSSLLSAAGLAAVVAGWILVYAALRANAFATTVVRLQPERGQKVVDRGVYSRVRHPMYAGIIPVMIGLSLWLGSFAGAALSLLPTAMLIIRIVVEEGVLRHSLPGYDEYSRRVRYRLIPFVW
jgi:protein-S-isoprenylcysteine O-methyltransferase Ste14